jgi:protein-disulfide isomerase
MDSPSRFDPFPKVGGSHVAAYNKRMKIRAVVMVILLLAVTAFGQSPVKPGREMGAAAAAIRIEVYSDFQCPHCKELYEKTLVPLVKDYVETGRVYLIHRDFPLPNHQYAHPAACYACAAERIGKYQEVCDVLFRKQESWSVTGKVDETVCSVLTPAEAAKVRALAKDPVILAQIEKDVDLGTKARLAQTPTMYITYAGHTYPVAGSVSYPILRRFLDNLPAK